MRKLVICLALFIAAVPRLIEVSQAGGKNFYLPAAKAHLPYREEWEPKERRLSRAQIQAILSQPFTYIGNGAQCYAFGSADGQWVVKLLKFRNILPHPVYNYLPDIGPIKKARLKSLKKRENKLNALFHAFLLAERYFSARSGVFYTHLNRGSDLGGELELIDDQGVRYLLNPDETYWILQERFIPVDKILPTLSREQLLEIRKDAEALIQERVALGLFDEDGPFFRNYGLKEGKVRQLDVGRLVERQVSFAKQRAKTLNELDSYLSERE